MVSLSQRSLTALLWGVLGTVLRVVLQVISQIVLARLLGPEPYGLFATALVAILFASFFSNFGLAYGLIQRQEVTREDIRFVFTWQVILGGAMTVLLIMLSGPIAVYYGDARLEPVLRWLSLSCVVTALGATANALLSRELHFRALNASVVIGYAVGFFGFGIPMALVGFGVNALMASYLIQSLVASAIAYASIRHAARPLFWQRRAPSILSFSFTVLVTNLVNWVMSSLDRFVVAWTLGLTPVGLYSTMQNFISTPSSMVMSLLQSVLYSASSRVQESHEQLRRGFRIAFSIVSLFTMPVFFAMGAVSRTLVAAVFGQKWMGGADVLLPLSWAMPGYILMGMAVPLLWTSGRTRQEFILQLPLALIWGGVLYAIARLESLSALCWAVCALYYLRAAVISGATLRALDLPASEIPGLLSAGVSVTALVTAVAFGSDHFLRGLVADPLSRLLIIVVACAIAMIVGLRLVRRLIRAEVFAIMLQLAERDRSGFSQVLMRRMLNAGEPRRAVQAPIAD